MQGRKSGVHQRALILIVSHVSHDFNMFLLKNRLSTGEYQFPSRQRFNPQLKQRSCNVYGRIRYIYRNHPIAEWTDRGKIEIRIYLDKTNSITTLHISQSFIELFSNCEAIALLRSIHQPIRH